MVDVKDRDRRSHRQVAGIVVLVLLALVLLWFNYATSLQAVGATAAKVRFEGEYRIGEGQWKEIIPGQHIPATKGDVTLRGNFHMFSPGGEYIGLLRPNILIAFIRIISV